MQTDKSANAYDANYREKQHSVCSHLSHEYTFYFVLSLKDERISLIRTILKKLKANSSLRAYLQACESYTKLSPS